MRLEVNEIRMACRVFKVGLTEHDRHDYVRKKQVSYLCILWYKQCFCFDSQNN